jgi:hypothetical protein
MSTLKNLKSALFSLWASICLQAISAYLAVTYVLTFRGSIDILLVAMPTLLFALLAFKISQYKNWARSTFLWLFLIFVVPNGLLKSIPFVAGLLTGQLGAIAWYFQFMSTLVFLGLLLQSFCAYVLFTKPVATQFKSQKP